ncbi:MULTISPECIES: TIM-barrel domain-containing protein [unclassified Prevotella]|uniref:glycoside hydrolase family 31 protein n=1 Tax=unclassified Prevotella TaxID=2638335 RepID=UPI000B97826A|nr:MULTISPECIES: TIM-barrel domain-containing protein [unclassified Prevotella]MBS7319863.1 alpha-xylosidase [Prevotella sp.]MDY4683935.1 glycoside hydrolase family 31 protein [Prevotella sp.]MEE1140791.1 glycoside hydrolase family 31 protein [Prevotella sp.]OYP39636.1 alpha-xylosidase [Prevotella sp. P5-50]OYP46075.1 alpha-xylosidase [Prevotella sp. P4-119]
MKKILLSAALLPMAAVAQIQTSAGVQYLQCQAKDMSGEFSDLSNTYFLADSLAGFDLNKGEGLLNWKRYRLAPRQAFNLNGYWPVRMKMLDFPDTQYDNDPNLRIKVQKIDNRTLRVTIFTSPIEPKMDDANDPMFSPEFIAQQTGEQAKNGRGRWNVKATDQAIVYKNNNGSLEIQKYPFRIVLRDGQGKLLTQTRHIIDNDSTQVKLLPFNFIKRGSDNSRSINPVLMLSPNERIYGCGESFTSLNKVGQKVQISVVDPQGPETDGMYKPVPFYFSNRGYGIFMHTSAPTTADFGASYIGAQRLFMGDETMDFFIFFGEPKDVLNAYTDVTGKSPMLPLWTFGTWMSRITYFSQEEGLDIARKLRANKIPSDVIHFDTGWFGVDWQCDYEFAKDRFKDPVAMLKSMKKDGFHTCLWQLPYFTPKNRYFRELVDGGMAVHNGNGTLSYEDAVLDLSNPKTVAWYQGKIANLIKQGVSAIKCDFGEAAPYDGIYASGKTGFYEHNLYPLRYNKALWQAVRDNTPDHEGVIWARSAWAGSQRYPLHWGGDAATNEIGSVGMLGDLRGGLSFGLSGFSFWSHDMGGFVTKSPDDLYRRWLPFGFLSSHTRAHGAPPTEPWLISESFTKAFRQSAEMKYKLMPYVYAQAKDCSERGLPMVRALLVEFPDDPGAWFVEDEYMFGSQILVAPMLETGKSRTVYLPRGKWIDYQTGKVYEGGYQTIPTAEIPCVILVKDGSLIPHVPVAQNTGDIKWDKVELKAYKADATKCTGLLFRPGDKELQHIEK